MTAERQSLRKAISRESISEIDAIFADYHLDSHSPGVSYGIVSDDGFVHLNAFGYQDIHSGQAVTEQTIFRIASMSKAFIALAILMLRDEGKLSLEEPAEIYVPELRTLNYPTADSPRITVRNLLNHTAGFVTDNPWADRQESLSEDDFRALLHDGISFGRAPGVAYDYSNFSYVLLGQIIKSAAGEPYDQFVARSIFAPLGMHSTSFHVDDWPIERRAVGYRWHDNQWTEEPVTRHGTFGAIGGVLTSAADYARWMAGLLNAWPAGGHGPVPIRRDTLRELATGSAFPFLHRRPGKEPVDQAAAYATGLFVIHDPVLGKTLSHGGGYPGYGSYMLALPDRGIGLFVFTNRSRSSSANPVWDAALALDRLGSMEPRPIPVSPALAEAYAAVREIFRAGTVEIAADLLANNFLMDLSAADWAAHLGTLRAELGECDAFGPIEPDNALAGSFAWRCSHGRVKGELVLAPMAKTAIQSLQFTVLTP